MRNYIKAKIIMSNGMVIHGNLTHVQFDPESEEFHIEGDNMELTIDYEAYKDHVQRKGSKKQHKGE